MSFNIYPVQGGEECDTTGIQLPYSESWPGVLSKACKGRR